MVKPIITVEQASTALNKLIPTYLGEEVVINTDLTNLVDFGAKFENLSERSKGELTGDLIALITEQIFISKPFTSNFVNIKKSYAGIDSTNGLKQRNYLKPLEAVDDPSVNPVAGESSDPFVNYGIEMDTKYFANKMAFMVVLSKYENAYHGIFKTSDTMMSFVGAVEREAMKAVEIRLDEYARLAVNGLIASVIKEGQGTQVVHLLTEYNARFPQAVITADEAMSTPTFVRFLASRVQKVKDALADYNTLHNVMKYPSQTTDDETLFLINSDAVADMNSFTYPDIYNLDIFKLKNYTKIYKWMGAKSKVDRMTIDVNIKSPETGETLTCRQDNVVALLASDEAVGIYGINKRVTTQWDPVALKTNMFIHVSGSAESEVYENAVVFLLD